MSRLPDDGTSASRNSKLETVPSLVETLERAEDFIAGFEHDDTQEGIAALLPALRLAKDQAGAAADLHRVLVSAIEESGFLVSGPTDVRVAEHGEPAWVCEARAALARFDSASA